MDNERPSTTVQSTGARLADLDVEPSNGELQRVGAQAPTPVTGRVVRDLPKNAPQVEQSAIVRHSEEHIGEVFAALAAAQGEFGEIERTLRARIESSKANYTYDYAPLDEVLQAVRPALSKNGLSIMQFPFAVNGAVTVRTLLGHSSGGWFFNDLRVTTDGNAPRETGSAITYARRYALMAMLGVAPAVDDDGGAAQPKGEPPRAGQRRSAAPEPPAERPQPQVERPSSAPASSAPAQPAGNGKAKPSGRAAKAAQVTQAAPAQAGPQETSAKPATPPSASQPAQTEPSAEGSSSPNSTGRIAEIIDKPNGAIVVLDTGFRTAVKDVQQVKDLKNLKTLNATIKVTSRPSSDPSRYAPVFMKADIVRRDREPGEEG